MSIPASWHQVIHQHQRQSIQDAWDSYSWGKITAADFSSIVATVLQLDNHPKPEGQ